MSEHRAAVDALVAELDGVEAVEDLRGEHALVAQQGIAKEFIRRLRDELSFELLNFVTALDNYLDEPRFRVVYHLRSLTHNVDLRISVPVGGEDPEVETITDLYPAANWLEREVWDMFGIRFSGHPDLNRILMDDGFVGHPLRKDYPLLGNTPGTPGHVGKGGKL